MRFVTIFFAILVTACSSKPEIITRTVYEYVPYPSPCKVPAVKRPARSGDVLIDTLSILEYTETLERLINACKGE